VTTLVRRESYAKELEQSGAKTVLGSLEDSETIIKHTIASDIVIHTATADHLPSVQAVIDWVNGHPAPVPKNTFYGLTDDRTIQDVQTVSARIDHRVNDALTISNRTSFSHSMTDARETAANAVLTGPLSSSTALTNGNYTSLPMSALYVRLASHDRVIENHSVDNDTMAHFKFDTGFVKHDLIAGVEVGHDSYTNQAYTRSGLPILSLIDPA